MKGTKYSLSGKLLSVVLLMTCSSLLSFAQYCSPTYVFQCASSTYIDNVIVTQAAVNFNNMGSGCGNTTTSYSDFTTNAGMMVTQKVGDTITLSVRMGPIGGAVGTYMSRIHVYVDWNQDGDFSDPGELCGSMNNVTGNSAPGVATIIVPNTAINGVTRMRLRAGSRRSIPEPGSVFQPCNQLQEGETEDYNLTVTNSTVSVKSLTNNSDFSISGYPNPVTSIYTVNVVGITGEAHLSLLDVTGRLVQYLPVRNQQVKVDVSTLPSGMYLLKYQDEQRNELIKFNKQ